MFVCVVGTSTAFPYWAFGVAALAMEQAAGEFHRIHGGSADELRAQLREPTRESVLFTTDVLDERLSDLLLQSGAPIVAVIDDADIAIKTAAKLRGLSCFDAIRLSSRYIASLADVLNDAATTVFAADARTLRVADFVPKFLTALGLSDPEIIEQVLRGVAPSDRVSRTLTVDAAIGSAQEENDVAASWSAREREACQQLAADYQSLLDRSPIQQINWPAAIHYAATPGFETDKPLELFGPARLLVWGPYMYLPKGWWTASMEFEVVGNLSPNSVIADVLVGGEFAEIGEFDLPVRGVFSWKLTFEVRDVEKPIEVRLTLDKAAIEGALFLRQVQLRPVAAADAARRPAPAKPRALFPPDRSPHRSLARSPY